MFFTTALQVVYKTSGGRIWNKRWGLPRLSRTRKENRTKDIKLFNQNIEILKAAEHLQPEVPVRLSKPLPQWQVDIMRQRLEAAQQQINLRSAGGAALKQQQQEARRLLRQQQQQMAGPPEDPQLRQRLNQQAVTQLRQQRQQQQQQRQPQKQQKGVPK